MLRFLLVALLAYQAASSPVSPQSPHPELPTATAANPADISKIRTQAEAGDPVAQFELGKAYETGTGLPQNYSLALTWFRKSAEQGNATAENSLGIMYGFAQGVEKSYEEAVRWYAKAARDGSSEAMFNLGASYYNGEGVAENPVLAYAWFLLAQEAGNPAAAEAVHRSEGELGRESSGAFVRVGEMYENGDTLPQNYDEAARWYRKAADRDPEAALKLATLMIRGTGGKQDYPQAMTLCNEYAKKHYPTAEYCVGYLYQHGLGVVQDSKQAAKLCGEAAIGGHTKAALALAEMYLRGEGVSVDRPEAFCYLYFAYKTGARAAKDQAHSLRQEMSREEMKRLEKRLKARGFDPKKVFAIVDNPASPDADQMRKALPPVRP